MNIYVLNTQDGTVATVASEASTPIALLAGIPAIIYVRGETAIDAADFGGVSWVIAGSGGPAIAPSGEIQSGGTTTQMAANVSVSLPLPGTYEISVIAHVASGASRGIHSVRLAVTVSAGALPGSAAVPSIRLTYPQRVLTEGLPTAAFHFIAGFPIWFTLSACGAPTSWTAVSAPPGLAIDNTGAVSGSIAASGDYEITVYASNAAGHSVSVSFPIVVTDPVAGVIPAGGTAALLSAVSWLPANIIDLQFDFRRRIVLSGALAVAGQALKAGDDLQFAVLPSLAGTPITSLITGIKLTIKPKDRPFAPALYAKVVTGAPIAPVVLSGHSYWLVTFNLSGAAINAVWEEINDLAAGAAPGTATPEVRALDCDFELRVTHNSLVYTAATAPVKLLQSVIDAPES